MKPTRLAYFVHGRGRGHASRALSVVPALRCAGYVVSVFASGAALPMLGALGPVVERPLVRPGASALRTLLQRSWYEARELPRMGKAAVLSDGDQGALLAARALGLPALAIGHDLVFSRCELPAGLTKRWLVEQRINALVPGYLSTRRVAVHFLPVRTRDPATLVARPLLDDVPEAHGAPRIARIVGYFRDANGEHVQRLARAVCPELLCVEGPNAASHLDRAAFRALLASSLAVIGSAGSNLLAECVLTATPMLALYRENDAEQALNAQWLEAAGAGMAASFERLDAEHVARFWRRARAREFTQLPLASALPSVVDAVLESLDALGLRAH